MFLNLLCVRFTPQGLLPCGVYNFTVHFVILGIWRDYFSIVGEYRAK